MKEISEMKIYDNGSLFGFTFKGNTKKEVDEKLLNDEINSFMEEFSNPDMISSIEQLRKILKDFKEEILNVIYIDKEGYEVSIKLCCKELYLYTAKRVTKDTTVINLKYLPTGKIDISISNDKSEVLNQESNFNNQQEIINIINDIYCLRDLEEEKVKIYTRKWYTWKT